MKDEREKICQDDFKRMFEEALLEAGGTGTGQFLNMPLRDVIKVLAQNGIRMVYIPGRSITSLEHVWGWKDKTKTDDSSVGHQVAPLSAFNEKPPKKRQLLCDQMDGRSTDDEMRSWQKEPSPDGHFRGGY